MDAVYYQRHKAKDPEKLRARERRNRLRREFGMTEIDYQRMLEAQGGVCALCATAPKKPRLNIDHCHLTGRVRALLCDACNCGLGFFRDDPEALRRAAAYVEAHAVAKTA